MTRIFRDFTDDELGTLLDGLFCIERGCRVRQRKPGQYKQATIDYEKADLLIQLIRAEKKARKETN